MAASTRSDEELVEAIRAGDIAAFDVLYGRYERRLFGYVMRFLEDRPLAEDVFQDVLFTVLKDRTFDPKRGRFGAWLFRVARNRCLSVRRQASNRSVALGQESLIFEEAEGERSDAAIVRTALSSLTGPQQQLLVLKQVGGLSYTEIAAALGIAEGTVKSRLHAATQAFRKKLERLGEAR